MKGEYVNMEIIDSYERFMNSFNIDKDDFYKFGINVGLAFQLQDDHREN